MQFEIAQPKCHAIRVYMESKDRDIKLPFEVYVSVVEDTVCSLKLSVRHKKKKTFVSNPLGTVTFFYIM